MSVGNVRGTGVRLQQLLLELTGRCGLRCVHCYADSSPKGSHGDMTYDDWIEVLDQAAAMEVSEICFIGGEPTLYPRFPKLLSYAMGTNWSIRLCTNLVSVSAKLWGLLDTDRIVVQVSYYSDDPRQHDRITGVSGSHARTLENLHHALEIGVRVNVSIINVLPDQRAHEAVAQIRDMGITQVRTDRLRRIGRGGGTVIDDVRELCGKCSGSMLAVLPDGTVAPCVLSRWMRLADIRTTPLELIADSPALHQTRDRIRKARDQLSLICGGSCAP